MKFRKHLMLIIAGLLVAAHPAQADDELSPACPGRDLFAELKNTEPEAFARISKAAESVKNSRSLYWKIAPPNGAAPSYLLGTAHVTDARIAAVKPALHDRIIKSKVAVFELSEVANRIAMSENVFSNTALTQLPDGQTLWDLLPDREEEAIRRDPRIVEVPVQTVERFQPWVVSVLTTVPLCESQRKQSRMTFDEALAQLAQFERVSIKGLETVDEQMAVFASMSLQDQTAMLSDSTTLGISPEDSFHTLLELYLARRITALEPLMAHLAASKGFNNELRHITFMENLIDKRNINMAERSKAYLDEGAAFIAVGALHLPGEHGVVELLRKAGYKVTSAE
jgi:uncharacterized protein